MLSDLNDYLLNDLSMIVIEYIKFSDQQLSLLMNQKMDPRTRNFAERYVTKEEQAKLTKYFRTLCSCTRFRQDPRLSIVYAFQASFMVNTENFSKQVDITQAIERLRIESKKSFHFHGSTIVVADDDKTFRVYDFDLDFT
jgi:hypothetical protein